jgi:hypothetical protein
MAVEVFAKRLSAAVPAELRKDLVSKLHYAHPLVAKVRLDQEGLELSVELGRAVEEIPPDLEPKLDHIISQVVDNYVPMQSKVYLDRRQVQPAYDGDIQAELEAGGHAFRLGQGQYGFGPLFWGLMAYFDGRFQELGRSLGAREHRYPTLIPARIMHRCQYFTSFPQSISMCCHLPEDIQQIEQFMDEVKEKGVDELEVKNARIENVLSSAVCYHAYHQLEGSTLPPDQDGVSLLCVGKCFRYESGNLTGIERLWDFTMREIVFVGSPGFVQGRREQCLQWVQDLLEELDLCCAVETATDPFFAGDAMKKALFQKALQLKWEVLVRLPHQGRDLAVGSLNLHQDFFGQTFDIKLADGTQASTGCTAFGVERFVLGFLAQYGLDQSRWPDSVREGLAGIKPEL